MLLIVFDDTIIIRSSTNDLFSYLISGFVKATPKGCDWDWCAPGENGFIPKQCISTVRNNCDDDNLESKEKNSVLKIFCDVPVLRLSGGGATRVIKLSLNGAGIGLHGAIVLSELLQRNNTVTHLYLSENNIGTRGCICLGNAIFGINRSVVFVDLRSNNIQNQAILHCGEILQERLKFGLCGDLGGNRPPPSIVTFDVQNNKIGGYGVSSELPGLEEFLDCMNDMVIKRMLLNNGSATKVNVYLSGNQIRPTIARSMVAKFTGTRLKLFVDVRQ